MFYLFIYLLLHFLKKLIDFEIINIVRKKLPSIL